MQSPSVALKPWQHIYHKFSVVEKGIEHKELKTMLLSWQNVKFWYEARSQPILMSTYNYLHKTAKL